MVSLRMGIALVTVVVLGPMTGNQTAAIAQQVPPPYDAIQAGQDAARFHEARRLRNIRRQLKTIERIKWFDQTIYYDGRRPGVFGSFGLWLPESSDIFGYRWYDPVAQPIGQRTIQTGPNRWESHPVYAEPAVAPLPRSPSGPREF